MHGAALPVLSHDVRIGSLEAPLCGCFKYGGAVGMRPSSWRFPSPQQPNNGTVPGRHAVG
jgi:hypothetical protein